MAKRQLLKEFPTWNDNFQVDANGEPIWNEEVHGQFAMLVAKIDKGDGLTESEVVSFSGRS